ncbi:trimethyllysine dioxygenase [Fimicolochytrium jonesii]|uniref:trimethyllysine dioxygenase n=1 Tax=Fimicolochytrium jonesii TaxID=1396493 RepID=UPI0022FDBAEE|nr:trimethyllysine dioxygenase [Fimicolochytrium jonesii]KAI8820458.1 trimethyllysine dioxygenase [Fimicolochytrium jonesii]
MASLYLRPQHLVGSRVLSASLLNRNGAAAAFNSAALRNVASLHSASATPIRWSSSRLPLTNPIIPACRFLTTPTSPVLLPNATPSAKPDTSGAELEAWISDPAQYVVSVRFPDGAVTAFDSIWLRDHCRCPACFHQVTKQRLLDTCSIPADIKPTQMVVSADQTKLDISWANDGHVTSYDLAWLRKHSYAPKLQPVEPAGRKRPKLLWDREIAQTIPSVRFDDVMNTEEGLAKWLENTDIYGIGFVDGVPTTPEATEKLARRIAFIRETHYGGFWDVSANMAHGDTAYTAIALPAHTDTTYFTDPIGLQLFHILEHSGGVGGESLYVDAFHVADRLRTSHPWAYDVLSRTRISAHSAGDANTHIKPAHTFPILNHDPATGALYQIRFNNDDRSPLVGLSPADVREFYAALREWTKLMRDPANELWIKLQPGRAAMVDNWRVLHGRASFTGYRRLTGAYINWDDFRSRVRTVLDKEDV